jgi:hypothetical protein
MAMKTVGRQVMDGSRTRSLSRRASAANTTSRTRKKVGEKPPPAEPPPDAARPPGAVGAGRRPPAVLALATLRSCEAVSEAPNDDGVEKCARAVAIGVELVARWTVGPEAVCAGVV